MRTWSYFFRMLVKLICFSLFTPCLLVAQELRYSLDIEEKKGSLKEIKLRDIGFLKRDTEYYTSSLTPYFDVIFNEDFINFSTLLFYYSQEIDSKLSQVFEVPISYRKNSVLFSSSRNQIPQCLCHCLSCFYS